MDAEEKFQGRPLQNLLTLQSYNASILRAALPLKLAHKYTDERVGTISTLFPSK